MLLMFACIKPFNPQIEGNAVNKLVVSGMITDIEGYQEVNISYSSPINVPEYNPVSGCIVNILDNNGNIFLMSEDEPGKYRAWFGKENLIPGTSYKVTVYTPEGETIESSYDTLMPGPSLDSVYYFIEDIPTSDPDVYIRGIQFYVDLDATGFECRNYRWEIAETWEFHAVYPAEYYYDGKFHQIVPPDYSRMVCWANTRVKNVYALSTKTLSQNVFLKYPLHFVDGHSSSRLGILYSILVSQQSLSESAYNFWEQVRINSNGLGGLYETQPLAIKGNLLNFTNPGRDVLGFFYASSVSSKRYFYKDIEGLELDFSNNCNETALPISGWPGFRKSEYPVYYIYKEGGALRILSDQCIDCRLSGGKTIKPSFWPQ